MKKMRKVIALALTATVLFGTLTGCESHKSVYATEPAETTAAPTPVEGVNEGAYLNILTWNDEFPKLMENYYPGYSVVNDTTGKIGNVTVKWHITTNDNNQYQDALDQKLFRQRIASADDKIDIFLIESDYAVKYINSSFTMPLQDLGIGLEELSQQYRYTQTIGSDSGNNPKAVSWQACPGALIYNRKIAKEAFGTDEPDAGQKKVADWKTFEKSAAAVQAKGYYMLSGYDDTYPIFLNQTAGSWLGNDGITIDESLMNWVAQTKDYTEKGYNNGTSLWDKDWLKGFYPDGKVFCYFAPSWIFANFMDADKKGSIANDGGWAVTQGPSDFFLGGSWICAASGTDNPTLVTDIMRKLTIDPEIMKQIALAEGQFINNKAVMQALAADTSYGNPILGGQNPFPIFCKSADALTVKGKTYFDQGCNQEFVKAMKQYFDGYLNLEESLDEFYYQIFKRYPTLQEQNEE